MFVSSCLLSCFQDRLSPGHTTHPPMSNTSHQATRLAASMFTRPSLPLPHPIPSSTFPFPIRSPHPALPRLGPGCKCIMAQMRLSKRIRGKKIPTFSPWSLKNCLPSWKSYTLWAHLSVEVDARLFLLLLCVLVHLPSSYPLCCLSTSNEARCLKVGRGSKRKTGLTGGLLRAPYTQVGGSPGALPQKNTEFVTGGDAISRCLEGLSSTL